MLSSLIFNAFARCEMVLEQELESLGRNLVCSCRWMELMLWYLFVLLCITPNRHCCWAPKIEFEKLSSEITLTISNDNWAYRSPLDLSSRCSNVSWAMSPEHANKSAGSHSRGSPFGSRGIGYSFYTVYIYTILQILLLVTWPTSVSLSRYRDGSRCRSFVILSKGHCRSWVRSLFSRNPATRKGLAWMPFETSSTLLRQPNSRTSVRPQLFKRLFNLGATRICSREMILHSYLERHQKKTLRILAFVKI